MAIGKRLTFQEIQKLPEGTILWCDNVDGGDKTLGKLHWHEKVEAVFQYQSVGWAIKNPALYTLATDEEALLYKLENA